MKPNLASRPRIYDAEPIARQIRETFTQKAVRRSRTLGFGWPSRMQNIGDSLSVGYASDKWKTDGDYDLYKHLAESRNRVLAARGFLTDYDGARWPVRGPTVTFAGAPMPRHFAPLGFFEECYLQLYTRGSDGAASFGTGDDGVVQVVLKHAFLGGSKILWIVDTIAALKKKAPRGALDGLDVLADKAKGGDELDEDEIEVLTDLAEDLGVPFRGNQPFLFVYVEDPAPGEEAVKLHVIGEELDIEKDGIVG